MGLGQEGVSAEYVAQLYRRYDKNISDLLGAHSIPELIVEIVENAPYPVATVNNRIIANKKYFSERRDDGALRN